MACGKPVVSCQLNSGVPFVNQDRVTGLVVPPADADALAEALLRLIADPALRARLGEAGRDRAHAEFSLDVMVGRYWKLFERLTSARGGMRTYFTMLLLASLSPSW
jgi:rhamnosyl/mannosyltransferase